MIACGKSELSLFDPIGIQTSMVSGSFVDHYAVSDVKGSTTPIEFFIPGTQDDYMDLNDSGLYIKLNVSDSTGKALGAADGIAPTNFTLFSLFKDVSLTLNETVVQGGDNLYPYKAVMNSLLLFEQSTKNTQMKALGYIKEDKFNVLNTTRKKWIAGSKSLELYGPLHLDMMNQPKYLLPGVSIRIKLTRQDTGFSLFTLDPKLVKSKINIEQAILFIRRVKCVPSVLQGHEIGLERMNAVYPLQHMEMTTFTVGQGQQSTNKENCLRGKMPKLMIVGMVTNQAVNGAIDADPFNFQHFDLSYLGLFREGESVPYRSPIQMDFTNNEYLRAYMNNIHALETFNKSENNGITIEDFVKGNSLFVFNLTPDLCIGGGCAQPYRNGNLRLELKFKSPLPTTINVLVYGLFDASLEITKLRNIQTDY